MGLKDIFWRTGFVGKITKFILENFNETNDSNGNNKQFKILMEELGYRFNSDSTSQKYFETINGNPVLFTYILICMEYSKMPNQLDDTIESIGHFICDQFVKYKSEEFYTYYPNFYRSGYSDFITDCKSLLFFMKINNSSMIR